MFNVRLHQLYCQRFLTYFDGVQNLLNNRRFIDAANELDLICNCLIHRFKRSLEQLSAFNNRTESRILLRQIKSLLDKLESLFRLVNEIRTEIPPKSSLNSVAKLQRQIRILLNEHIDYLKGQINTFS